MSKEEDDFLAHEAAKKEVKVPIFGPPDGKILAVGDLFRGPSTGISSELDLNNPGNKLAEEDVKLD